MIGLFKPSATKNDLLQFNGDYVLDSICIEALESEELSGDYSFSATFIISDKMDVKAYDLLNNESWIKVDGEHGVEYFKITQVSKSSNSKYIDVFARHITIAECLTLWCEDVRPTNLNGAATLNWIFDNAIGVKMLELSSDITRTNTSYFNNKNVYECLFTADNSFLERWGGEVYRRGFRLTINNKVGQDRGVTIRSRKNLKGLEEETNLNSLCTRIYPKGFDGITINEKFVDSPFIDNYSRIYTKEVKFENVKVKGENQEEGFETLEEAQAELKRLANLMFTENKVDVIGADYKIDFVELGKTEEYKNYQMLERTFLGDYVEVKNETLGIDINVRVTKRVYDCLRKERLKTELSNKDTKNKPPSIQDVFNKLEMIPDEEEILFNAKEQAGAILGAGIKDSYVLVRKNEILIMDSKDINTAVKLWRFNVNGWGYSRTGYNGTYEVAATMDGEIVADFITVGTLNANLIKAGVLKSLNNLSYIDMTTGSFNFANKIKFDGTTFTIDFSETGLATKEEVSELIDQTTEEIKKDFATSGGSNLLRNGNFKNGLRYWTKDNDNSGDSVFVESATASNLILDGKNALAIARGNTTGKYGANSFEFQITKQTNYVASVLVASNRTSKIGMEVIGEEQGVLASVEEDIVTRGFTGGKSIKKWKKLVLKFNSAENTKARVKLFVSQGGNTSYTWFIEAMVNEGTLEVPFIPNSEELINARTIIDKEGVTIENGALAIKNNVGVKVLEGDSHGNLKMRIWDSAFEMSATGERKTIMQCDINDKFHLTVPFQNLGSGFMIRGDTGVKFIEAQAGDEFLSLPRYTIVSELKCDGNIHANGNLTCNGSKNALQKTVNYGDRLINAYETAEYYFGDIGSGVIKSGECIVYIDEIFQECINTNVEYHVFTQAYNGYINRIERNKNYFIVFGEDNTSFSWEIKGKRIGYENTRLDKIDIKINGDSEVETVEYLLMSELTFNLEDFLLKGDVE